MSGYCKIAPDHPIHHMYHAKEYGFPITNERDLFERMTLEIMQAGLSWEIILKKRRGFKKAFEGFSVKRVSNYKSAHIRRLLLDSGIIRNRLKINAVIYNANQILYLKKTHRSFAAWIEKHHPLTKNEWTKLFKKNFKFMGGEIVGEFLMSIGYLPGSHDKFCPIYKQVLKKSPPWFKAKKARFDYEAR